MVTCLQILDFLLNFIVPNFAKRIFFLAFLADGVLSRAASNHSIEEDLGRVTHLRSRITIDQFRYFKIQL